MGRFEGRSAVVTGGSRGIGFAVARALAADGAAVMLTARDADRLAAATDALRREGATDVRWTAANAGDPEAPDLVVAAAVEAFGGVDVLVNNAAACPFAGPLLDTPAWAMDKMANVNQRSIVLWCAAAHHRSTARRPSAIVNVASIGGEAVDAGGLGYYNATKAAVAHLTRQLAFELGPGTRVNAVAPGLVKTDMARTVWEADEPTLAGRLPLQRLGEPADIAAAVAFLASDDAGWITGQVLSVDGGGLLLPLR